MLSHPYNPSMCSSITLLDAICCVFNLGFFFYIHKWDWPMVFFSCLVLISVSARSQNESVRLSFYMTWNRRSMWMICYLHLEELIFKAIWKWCLLRDKFFFSWKSIRYIYIFKFSIKLSMVLLTFFWSHIVLISFLHILLESFFSSSDLLNQFLILLITSVLEVFSLSLMYAFIEFFLLISLVYSVLSVESWVESLFSLKCLIWNINKHV